MEELRVSIIADASGLAPGLSSATQQVQAAATTMAEAQTIATQATQNLAAAQAQLGAAAVAGNAQAKAILAQYTAELAAAKTQLTQVTAAETEQVVSAEALAGATTEATAATEAFASAQTAASVATSSGISSRQAATASIGLLEGRMMSSNRAAGAFLATTLGLGPALQVAFPVIGAIAIAGVLVDIGEKAYQLYEKFLDISAVDDKLIADFRKMRDSDVFNVHSIETATERLDDATKAAGNLRSAADALHEVSLKDVFGDLLGGNVLGAGADIGYLAAAKKLADEGGKQTEDAVKLTVIQLKQEHELALAKIETAHAADGLLPKEREITAEQQKRLEIVRENQNFERKEEQALGNKSPHDAGAQMAAEKEAQANAEATVARYEDQLPLLREISRARIEAAHAADAELAPVERITAELSKQVELNESAAQFSKVGTAAQRDQLVAMQNQEAVEKAKVALGALGDEAIDRAFKQQIDEQDRAAKLEEENEKRAAELYRQKREIAVQAARDEAAATISAAQQDYAAIQQEIRFEEQLGAVSHRVAAQRLADASAKKTTATTGALGKEQGIFDPAEGGKEAREYQELQDKITAEARKGALERERIQQEEALKMAQVYKRVTTEFNAEFSKAFNEWATKSRTAGDAFGHMLGDLELKVIDFAAKTVLEHAAMWLEVEILSATGNATLLAQKESAAAIQKLSDAKTAAANAYAWGSGWGGPIAGGIAAAIAFTAVEAFEMGGVVGGYGPQMIQAHAGERVLSAGQTTNFESLVNNGGNRSASLHQENHFGGGVTREMLAEHTTQTMNQLRSMLRPEAFA